ncbi:MAG TPA: hypothetical protein VG649_07105 [Candidatus Angelobacter sp.]|jgi:hypothetical protein|nr:hypothetical protein [Candidatus Angelobacter sp.]
MKLIWGLILLMLSGTAHAQQQPATSSAAQSANTIAPPESGANPEATRH